jgi:hypothetical protein
VRGEALNLQLVIPEHELREALQDSLRHHFARRVCIEKLERRISEYCSSYILEELDVTLDDGTAIAMIFKDLSHAAMLTGAEQVKPRFIYNPVREIETYRRVLVNHRLGTAECYGAEVKPENGRYWLFLERVPPVLLWQMGELEMWKTAARWLAGMHAFLVRETELCESAHLAHLIEYDREFYWRWMRRATEFVSVGDNTPNREPTKAIRWLEERYEKVIERLLAMPVTVIHGEFFASNVLIDETPERLRICPVDWEMAAVGPGLIDLAALTSGAWSEAEKDAMALAYHYALPDDAPVKGDWQALLTDLECCRLCQAVQLLGWAPGWTPPPEHAQNWLKEALRAAEAISL